MGRRGRRRAAAARGDGGVAALIDGAARRWGADARRDAEAVAVLEAAGARASAALDRALDEALAGRWRTGWTPLTVVHVVRREGSRAHADRLAGVLVAQADRRRTAGEALHPRWEAQVNVVDDERGAPDADVRTAMDVLALLLRLPGVPPTVPPPGHPESVAGAHLAGLDERVLARVRALLAKAESTEFEAEAEALMAKAQELITRHAIDEVALHRDDPIGEPTVRHLLLDDPYMDAKAALLDAVVRANRSRAVFNPALGWVTVFGYDGDLDAVELLGSSLLAQATAAMARAGAVRDRSGRSRTRSFRRAFLYGFAARIGQRLREASDAQVDPERDDDLLPVLAARTERVDEALAATYPQLTAKRTQVSNGGGYEAGRAAADAASIGVPGGALR